LQSSSTVESLHGLTIGQRVARYRKAKGMSQEVLAHLLARSHSWLTKIERGERQLDSMSLIVEIARVLKVDVLEITGQPYRPSDGPPAHAAVPAMRRVLIGTGAGGADVAGADGLDDLPTLRARMLAANRLRHAADYDRLGEILPSLLEDLQLAANDPRDREAAEELVIDACHCARAALKALGYYDLAWIAVERARQTAERLDDPLLRAASVWNRCEVYIATGAISTAIQLALEGIDRLEGDSSVESPPGVSLQGMLHLKAGWGEAMLGREQQARVHLAEAGRLASRLGADRNDFGSLFGPTNVTMHGVQMTMELGLPREALARAAPVHDGVPMACERRARLKIALARAHSQLRQDDEATQLLIEVGRLAPVILRAHPLARELVAGMLQRAQRGVSDDLRSLAVRLRL
jgi:transcriptional regulator with XRE-family HTH domain